MFVMGPFYLHNKNTYNSDFSLQLDSPPDFFPYPQIHIDYNLLLRPLKKVTGLRLHSGRISHAVEPNGHQGVLNYTSHSFAPSRCTGHQASCSVNGKHSPTTMSQSWILFLCPWSSEKFLSKLGAVVHTYNPSSQEAEAGEP
jgi:hypothetical protein